jgi:2-keto-4-pentenoate hydratase/2-oxohepta-3-ene-1,7-dioic acid hydratase in catechol pathway
MPRWARVNHNGRDCFGTIEGEALRVHSGNMFAHATATDESIPRRCETADACRAGKMVALVDNYRALVAKLGHAVPDEPLYFLKAGSSFLRRRDNTHAEIVRRQGHLRRELGIVIGRRLSQASEADAEAGIFGYTCINDVTRSRSSPGTRASHNGRAPRASIRSACSGR